MRIGSGGRHDRRMKVTWLPFVCLFVCWLHSIYLKKKNQSDSFDDASIHPIQKIQRV